jgi:dehydrogenase/reductase SDR family protein 7B
VAGIVGSPMRSAYSAAKHRLIGYHDSIRAEIAHLGVKVLVVAPGSERTDVSRNALGVNAQSRHVSDEAMIMEWSRQKSHAAFSTLFGAESAN